MEKIILCIILVFALTDQISYGQGSEIHLTMLSNEFNSSEIGSLENIHCNPILLSGKPLDYETFNLDSKGKLILVKGNPTTPEATAIPFYIQLRRHGSIVRTGELMFLNYELFEIEISKVLFYAKLGDHLIINPTRPRDWKAKRIIKLIEPDC